MAHLNKSYDDMTEHEIRQKMAYFREKARKAQQLGVVNEFEVYQQKMVIAASHLVDLNTMIPGEVYRIEGHPGVYFRIEYLKGRFAWGYRLGEKTELEALPVALLTTVKM